MDAPLHFFEGGKGLEEMPLEAGVGRTRVLEVRDPVAVKPEHLRGARIRRGERLLLKTRNSGRCWRSVELVEDFAYITTEAVEYLVERGVQTVGIDYLSVGGFRQDTVETHQVLLGAGVWIIEGLNLAGVRPGRYELVCLPLRVVGADGAPARAILRRN